MGRRGKAKLVYGKDYTYENGRCVLTREFLLKQGECCHRHCANCPYPADDAPRDEQTCASDGAVAVMIRTAR